MGRYPSDEMLERFLNFISRHDKFMKHIYTELLNYTPEKYIFSPICIRKKLKKENPTADINQEFKDAKKYDTNIPPKNFN